MRAAAARRERARRVLARRRLLHFTSYTFPSYVADPVHALICEHLEAVSRGDIGRLIITAPPQHGKSELVSVRFPAWHLGQHPDDPIILTSYAASLAHSKSRQARGVVEGAPYRALFGDLAARSDTHVVATAKDSRAVHEWCIAGRRGGMVAAGVGGPITGHGARIGIIDDPFENWEQAHSQTIRDKVWDWYCGTFRPRVWEGGAIVLIMTRWHEDDLAGRLVNAHPGQWKILRLPALAETQEDRDQVNASYHLAPGLPDPLDREPGEALAPQRYSAPELNEIKAEVGEYVFGAEYQGGPKPPRGNLFKREWLPIVPTAPVDVVERVIYWDLGHTEDAGDFTVGVVMSLTRAGMITVEYVIRGQWSPRARNDVILQTAEMYADLKWDEAEETYTILDPGPVTYIEQEPGGGKDVVGAIRLHLAGFRVKRDLPRGDKMLRAEPFADYAEGKNVQLVRGPWNRRYIDELTAAPHGTNDDQLDGSSGAFRRLMRRHRRRARRGRTVEL